MSFESEARQVGPGIMLTDVAERAEQHIPSCFQRNCFWRRFKSVKKCHADWRKTTILTDPGAQIRAYLPLILTVSFASLAVPTNRSLFIVTFLQEQQRSQQQFNSARAMPVPRVGWYSGRRESQTLFKIAQRTQIIEQPRCFIRLSNWTRRSLHPFSVNARVPKADDGRYLTSARTKYCAKLSIRPQGTAILGVRRTVAHFKSGHPLLQDEILCSRRPSMSSG